MAKIWILLPLFLTSALGCRPKERDQAVSVRSTVRAGGETTINNRSSGAFTVPAPNLDSEELKLHGDGDVLFEAEFVKAPAPVHPGLGPTFNNTSCRGCHVRNGRGMPVLGEPGTLRSPMLVRVSLDPAALSRFPEALGTQVPGDGPYPVPGFGTQIQDQAVFGQEAEVTLSISWEEVKGVFADGSEYSLRKPKLSATGNADQVKRLNDPAVLSSIRQTPPVVGLGLLEAVSEQTLLDMEDPLDQDGDGISGTLNRVWDPLHQKIAIGRFGWKASAPSLIVQAGGAFAEDMGVKNPIAPDHDGSIEIDLELVKKTAYYTQTLAVPDRVKETSRAALRGEQLFEQLACAACHRPTLSTDDKSSIVALRDQTFAAYTDLLLHDMGEGLADHRPDFTASGSEWRTSPLWGLGLASTILPYSAYLHDGRARTLEEAILWHGGEAENSQKAYKTLDAIERNELVEFLKSL